jgi:DNA-directed RNA polymerase subunit alpha
MLSSLQGAAITNVRIVAGDRGSPSGGLLEDPTELILNLKEVVFRAAEAKTYEVHLEKEGPGVVRAGDVQLVDGLEVINPEHVLAVLDERGPLVMDLTVEVGRGYVPAERNKRAGASPGTIPIDAALSPVRKVTYTVTNARVGGDTDYDRLTLEVWTNGSVRPQEAVSYAARILAVHFSLFINFEETDEPPVSVPADAPLNEHLFLPVEELDLSVRSANCLRNANVTLIGDLVQREERELLKMRGFGVKSLREIQDTLRGLGLRLGTSLNNWPDILGQWQAQQVEIESGTRARSLPSL